MPNAIGIINQLLPPAGTPISQALGAQFNTNATVSVDPVSPSSYLFQLVISSGENGYITPPVTVAPGTAAPLAAALQASGGPSFMEVGVEILATEIGTGSHGQIANQSNTYPVF